VLLIENSNNYQSTVAGTYYAESVSGPINCISETRTPITLTINSIPQIEDETIVFCEGEITTLSADIDNANYLWNTGEITKEISITTQGEYIVEITNAQGCTATKQITVAPANIPVISDIRSDGSTILITLENSGTYEFALGSGAFQSSPIFENIPGGLYTISINYGDNCGTVSQEYIHLVIPKFFTPNSDNTNDLFVVEGLELFSSFELSIFNRFGQLLKNTNQDNPTWDGTLNGNLVPADTYWYQLTIEGTTRNGYFTLKR
jgi:gliding motility-associated-like protein